MLGFSLQITRNVPETIVSLSKLTSNAGHGTAIGRMYFISPTAGKHFYLRTLLCVVKGPRSFEDLQTYCGHRYSTFRKACLVRGLLKDDSEWQQCLEEACHMQTGTCL
jgi:hypothetical protein